MKTILFSTILLCFVLLTKAQDFQAYHPQEKTTQLTKNQQNTIIIQVPQKYDWQQIEFKADSAKITKKTSRGEISILPTGLQTNLKVYSQSELLKTLVFKNTTAIIFFENHNPLPIYRNCMNTYQLVSTQSSPIKQTKLIPENNLRIVALQENKVTLHVQDTIRTSTSLNFRNGDLNRPKVAFEIQEAPWPNFKLYLDNKLIDVNRGIGLGKSIIGNLKIRVHANEAFKSNCPDDAKYHVDEFKVTLVQRGFNQVLKSTKPMSVTFNTANSESSGNISNLMSHATNSGVTYDLLIQILKVSRKNYRNEIISMNTTWTNSATFYIRLD